MRDFDPSTGRYIESDPIGLDGGNNLFSYAFVNPITEMDATGEIPPAIVAIGAACARYPKTCIALIQCMKNPKKCAGPPCNLACRGYQKLCKGPGAKGCKDPNMSCAEASALCIRWTGCYVMRTICTVCRYGGIGHGGDAGGDKPAEQDFVVMTKCCAKAIEKCEGCSPWN